MVVANTVVTFQPSNPHARWIPPINCPSTTALRLGQLTTRRTGITRRDVQCRIPLEEVPRSEEERHGFGGHDRVVFGGGEMGDAKGVPEDCVSSFSGRASK